MCWSHISKRFTLPRLNKLTAYPARDLGRLVFLLQKPYYFLRSKAITAANKVNVAMSAM